MSIYLLLLRRKLKVAKTGAVDLKATALDCKAWPDEGVVKASNNLDNQFEAPVLFYALCFTLYLVDGVNQLTLILAWFFVASRLLHAYVHVNSNYVPVRMRVFAAGLGSLVFMALAAAWQMVSLGHLR